MSNGSAAILFLNPHNFKVEHYIVVVDYAPAVGLKPPSTPRRAPRSRANAWRRT